MWLLEIDRLTRGALAGRERGAAARQLGEYHRQASRLTASTQLSQAAAEPRAQRISAPAVASPVLAVRASASGRVPTAVAAVRIVNVDLRALLTRRRLSCDIAWLRRITSTPKLQPRTHTHSDTSTAQSHSLSLCWMSSFDPLGSSLHGHSRKANRADDSADGDNTKRKKKTAASKSKAGKAGKAGRSSADDRASQADQAQEEGYVPEHIRLEAEKEAKRLQWQRKHDGEQNSDDEAEEAAGEAGAGEEGESGSDDSSDAASASSSASAAPLVPLKLAMW